MVVSLGATVAVMCIIILSGIIATWIGAKNMYTVYNYITHQFETKGFWTVFLLFFTVIGVEMTVIFFLLWGVLYW